MEAPSSTSNEPAMPVRITIAKVRFLFWAVRAWPESPTGQAPTSTEARATGAMFVVGEEAEGLDCEAADEWGAVSAYLRARAEDLKARFRIRWLRAAVRRVGAVKFVPCRPPSWDYSRETQTVEICFYHAAELHDEIYLSDAQYIMQPTGELQAKLWELYAAHGTDEFDPDIWAHADLRIDAPPGPHSAEK